MMIPLLGSDGAGATLTGRDLVEEGRQSGCRSTHDGGAGQPKRRSGGEPVVWMQPLFTLPWLPSGLSVCSQLPLQSQSARGWWLHASGILHCLLVWFVDIACGKAIVLKQCVDEVWRG